MQLTDFFVIARAHKAKFYDFTSLHPTQKLVRLVSLQAGNSVPMALMLDARPDYGRCRPAWTRVSDNPLRYSCSAATLYSKVPVEDQGDQLTAYFSAERGQTYFAVLDYATGHRSPDLEEIHRWLLITKSYWREWNLFNYYRGAYEKIIRRSAVTLKLLTYAASGHLSRRRRRRCRKESAASKTGTTVISGYATHLSSSAPCSVWVIPARPKILSTS